MSIGTFLTEVAPNIVGMSSAMWAGVAAVGAVFVGACSAITRLKTMCRIHFCQIYYSQKQD